MGSVPSLKKDARRFDTLQDLQVLDTAPEAVFDGLNNLAAALCETPVALITLVDADRVCFKAARGLPDITEIPREAAFCDHAPGLAEVLEVLDTRCDERFKDNPLVTGPPHLRFYAGTPVVTRTGLVLGTLCVMDRVPRSLNASQREGLQLLSRTIARLLELRHAEQWMQTFRGWIEQSSQAAVIADAQGPDCPVVFVNAAFCALSGYSEQEMLGRNCRFLQGEDRDQPVLAALREAMAARRPGTWEIRNYRKDGTPFTNEVSLYPVFDEDRQLIHLVALAADVTLKRSAEEALRRSEERFRSLTALSADWYWEQDEAFCFTFLSAGQATLGYPENTWRGLTRWDGPGLDLSSADFAGHLAHYRAHMAFREFTYRRYDAQGSERWISVSGEPVVGPKGGFAGFRGVARDVTEQVVANRELKRHRDHLQELVEARTREWMEAAEAARSASQVKSEFLANMSHELRTPMHAILSFTELVAKRLAMESPDLPRARANLARIQESGQRLLHLLNDLLDLSKLEAGKVAYQMAEVDLGAVARDATDEFQALAVKRSQQLTLQVTGPSRAWCDGGRLGQVLRKLISNALKFTPEGKSVSVAVDGINPLARPGSTAVEPEDWLQIRVADDGVGIPEGEREAVFDQFVQSSKTRNGAGGTGLGLSICRQIMEQHGGSVWATANPRSGGALLIVDLPRRALARTPSGD